MNFWPNTPVGDSGTKPGSDRKRILLRLELILLVALILVLVLARIALSPYITPISYAREATLKQDCFVLRNAIQQYTFDNHAAPKSLDDLVQSKYISLVPTNPVTRQKFSLQDCVARRDDFTDPVQTIPGSRRFYSDSVGGSGDAPHFN